MKKLKKGCKATIIILIILAILVGATVLFFVQKKIELSGIDDWKYNPRKSYSESSSSSGILSYVESTTSSYSDTSSIGMSTQSVSDISSTSGSYLGYTVGGASNVDSFRQNIKNNYLPLSTDITYNGLYSE